MSPFSFSLDKSNTTSQFIRSWENLLKWTMLYWQWADCSELCWSEQRD